MSDITHSANSSLVLLTPAFILIALVVCAIEQKKTYTF